MEDETSSETTGGAAAPEVQARITTSFGRQGLIRHLGARLMRVSPGRVHIALPSRPEVTQQHGYFHAGATSAIADSAGGHAALTLFPDNTEVLTVEDKINLMTPAVDNHLEAVGTVLKSGRTLTVCRLEVFADPDGQKSMIAAGQQTLIRIPGTPEQ
jgi:uncharacterized protein (TIGR00369 family)